MLSRHSSLRGEIHVWTGTSWGKRTRRASLSPEVQSRSCPRAQTPAACVGVLGWLRPMVEQSHPAKSTSSASDLLMKAWIWAQENRVSVPALGLLSNSTQCHKSALSNQTVKLYKPRGEFSTELQKQPAQSGKVSQRSLPQCLLQSTSSTEMIRMWLSHSR